MVRLLNCASNHLLRGTVNSYYRLCILTFFDNTNVVKWMECVCTKYGWVLEQYSRSHQPNRGFVLDCSFTLSVSLHFVLPLSAHLLFNPSEPPYPLQLPFIQAIQAMHLDAKKNAEELICFNCQCTHTYKAYTMNQFCWKTLQKLEVKS